MTLNQILYFQKVARLENYHQAAEELYISQPSLSRSMAVLERTAFSGACRPDRSRLRCGSG